MIDIRAEKEGSLRLFPGKCFLTSQEAGQTQGHFAPEKGLVGKMLPSRKEGGGECGYHGNGPTPVGVRGEEIKRAEAGVFKSG